MIDLLMRRREMATKEVYPPDAIMTRKTNPEVLAICNAQGWCGSKYMTATEAAAVSDIGTVFKGNTTITHFEELQYFIGLTSIPSQAFYNCNKLKKAVLPSTITAINSEAFRGALVESNDFIIPEGVTTIGASAFYGAKIGKYCILPSTVTSVGENGFRNGSYRLLYTPPNCASFGSFAFAGTPNGSPRIAVINRNNRPGPSTGSPYIFQTGSTPKWKLYVPVGRTSQYPIKDGGTWVYKAYIQTVSEIPTAFDTTDRDSIKSSLDALDV